MNFTFGEIKLLASEIAAQVKADIMAELSPGKWLKVSEAAKYARVSKDTIYRWIKDGFIHANKRTGEWIIDRESIDDWFNQYN